MKLIIGQPLPKAFADNIRLALGTEGIERLQPFLVNEPKEIKAILRPRNRVKEGHVSDLKVLRMEAIKSLNERIEVLDGMWSEIEESWR